MSLAREWKKQRLDELGFVGRGKSRHRPRNDSRLFGGDHPFIQTADIMAADPYITTYSQTYSDFGLGQSKLWPPDTLCITIAGANTAKCAILKFEACFPDSIVGFIPNIEKADLVFVKYSLDLMRTRFLAVSRGATQDNLSLDKLLSFPIPVPPVSYQRCIGSILSAYDDLIENNTRRIAILEEIASRTYEEWFIRFRFPNRRKVSMVDSKLGPVPRGWTVGALSDIAVLITRGIAPKYDDDANGLVINQKCIRGQQLNLAEARRQSKYVPTEKIVQQGDVLINSTGVGTLGRVAQILREIADCTVDTHVTIVRRAQGCDPEFLGLALLYRQPYFEAQGVGSTGQTELSRSRIAETLLVIPPAAVQQQFGRVVGPIRLLAAELQAKNDILRATRDLLLPKLISGELDVSSLTQLEAAVA